MTKEQEKRLIWMYKDISTLTFEEKDGIIYINDLMILENGNFRSEQEGGKGTDNGYTLFTGYRKKGGKDMTPPRQTVEQYKTKEFLELTKKQR